LGASTALLEWTTDHLSLSVPRSKTSIVVPGVTHSDLLLSATVMVSVWLAQADVAGPEVAELAGTGDPGDPVDVAVGALVVACPEAGTAPVAVAVAC
jgi:hypothetical protein